jgi:NAD(P)H-hydrate epimerase
MVDMIPIVTPEEMAAVDAAAPEPVEVLIRRAAFAVAREALDLLGGAYGRRVLVLAGNGNNGNDGRVAGRLLATRGVRVKVLDVGEVSPETTLPDVDLVIDAAFGTGFRGTWDPPAPGASPVLAVDIPSGIDGLVGTACGSPWHAVRTVTFAALKPGLLQGDGPDHAGEVVVADIGLDVSGAQAHLVEDLDVLAWVPRRRRTDHKWCHAVWVVAGSPLMSGAGWLCSRGAMRGGAGYVRTSSPGVEVPDAPREAVAAPLPLAGWGAEVAEGASRFGAIVVGPGLGRHPGVRSELEVLLSRTSVPVLLDADALVALGEEPLRHAGPIVLSPHDGEYRGLMGELPGPDRLGAARAAADRHGAVVLLKGPSTVVAEPGGRALVVDNGDQRLATAGSGDVLSGLIGAHLSSGASPMEAAAAAARLHGIAGRLAGAEGVIAGDVAEVLGGARAQLEQG